MPLIYRFQQLQTTLLLSQGIPMLLMYFQPDIPQVLLMYYPLQMQTYLLSGAAANAGTIVSVCGYPSADTMVGLDWVSFLVLMQHQEQQQRDTSRRASRQASKQAGRTFASKPQTRCRLSLSLCLSLLKKTESCKLSRGTHHILLCFRVSFN